MNLDTPVAAEFDEETLEDILLPRARIEEKRFYDCTFVRCDFAGAHFTSCRFLGCSFEDCNLSNAHFAGATLREVRFERTKLLGIDWADAAHLDPPWFEECALDLSSFVGLKLSGSTWLDCSAKEVRIAETDLSSSDLRRTDFEGAEFIDVDLRQTDLREARAYAIDPRNNKVAGLRCTVPEAMALVVALGVVLE